MKLRNFIEDNFHIDDAETGKLIPFRLRQVQNKYYNQLLEDYSEEDNFDNAREIILKARKEGFTSLILAMFAAMSILSEDSIRSLEISYRDDATRQHFRRFKTYVNSYFALKLGIPIEQADDPELDRHIYSSLKDGQELVLAHNGASFYVGTASAKTAERGGTVQNILFSESAHYPDSGQINASEIVEGTQSMVAVGSGRIFHETTANGFNHFHTRWEQAERGEINYKPRFFSWRDFYTPEEFEVIKAGFSDKRKIPQEYPDSPTEAFLTSGSPYFDEEALTLYWGERKEPMAIK